jgi:thiol:disulfide interchange protein DsbD
MTCKVNEKRVLADARIAPVLEQLGYDVYRADWTRRDEAIHSALAGLGKAGVPVYAVYAPGAPDQPHLLPELLTVDLLLSALREGAETAHADADR